VNSLLPKFKYVQALGTSGIRFTVRGGKDGVVTYSVNHATLQP
jgi:hypothetical protein